MSMTGIPSRTGYFLAHFLQQTLPSFNSTSPLQAGQAIVASNTSGLVEALGDAAEIISREDIEKKMPHIFKKRGANKYHYVYPDGESYETMKPRIIQGIKKAFFLNRRANNVMIVGHQAVNRMILSHFLYRREDDVPYIYVPQDRFYHIISTQDKKLFELKRYD